MPSPFGGHSCAFLDRHPCYDLLIRFRDRMSNAGLQLEDPRDFIGTGTLNGAIVRTYSEIIGLAGR
jgi:hypothetical protein